MGELRGNLDRKMLMERGGGGGGGKDMVNAVTEEKGVG